jgi:hypothetical protein
MNALRAKSAVIYTHPPSNPRVVLKEISTDIITSISRQIWVAEGLLDCGAPLLTDACATLSKSVSGAEWEGHPVGSTLTTTSRTFPVITGTYIGMGTHQVDGDPSYTFWDTVELLDRSHWVWTTEVYYAPILQSAWVYGRATTPEPYTPVISSTTFARSVSSLTMSVASATALPSPGHRTLSAGPTSTVAVTKLYRRTEGGFVFCPGENRPDELATDSLLDVCHFVANTDLFVSLAPTSAAYMPSWLDYLISTLAILIQVVLALRRIRRRFTSEAQPVLVPPPTRILTAGGIFGLLGFVLAVIRTSFSVFRLIKHWESRDTLPFISPLLWVDWIAVVDAATGRGLLLGSIVAGFACCIWGFCLWLCIGYAAIGYGVRQYEVLFELPEHCNLHINPTAWQTDPRRTKFVQLHVAAFVSATLGGFLALFLLFRSGPTNQLVRSGDEGKRIITLKDHFNLKMGLFIVAPTATGIAIAAQLNSSRYLILHQGELPCYASFVSSHLGYLNIYFTDWSAKVATWLGINV